MVRQNCSVPWWCTVGRRVIMADGRPGKLLGVSASHGVVSIQLDDGHIIPETRADALTIQEGSTTPAPGDSADEVWDNTGSVPTAADGDRLRVGQLVYCKFRHAARGYLWYAGVVRAQVSGTKYSVIFVDAETVEMPRVRAGMSVLWCVVVC